MLGTPIECTYVAVLNTPWLAKTLLLLEALYEYAVVDLPEWEVSREREQSLSM
jgi:hypothetical protein